MQLHKIIPLSPFLYRALITSSRLQIFDVDLKGIICRSSTKLVKFDHCVHVHQRVKEKPNLSILQIETPGPIHQRAKENPICILQFGTPGPI